MVESLHSGVEPAVLREALLRDGVLVVQGVVPDAVCDAVIAATDGFLAANPPREDRQVGHGIVPLHHAQALWDLRTLESIYSVFAAIHGTRKLLVSVDRVSRKLPDECGTQRRSPIHWDCDPFATQGLATQGVVYLTDTAEEQGAFCCVPSIYRHMAAYRAHHAADKERRRPKFVETDVERVPARRGSLVVFHRLMPHSSEVNRATAPRYTQYVTMSPESDPAKHMTAQLWASRMPPEWAVQQRVPNQQMPEPGHATLTELGQRLAGLRDWE